MITGQLMTERQYRQLDALSQSMIKDFYDDRKRFYKKYIAGEEVDDDDPTQVVKMGNLVDCLLLTRETFDSKFMMSICTEIPTGLMLKFCQALAKETKRATDENGVIGKEFIEMAEAAHLESGFKWALSRVLEGFAGKEPEKYYTELLAAVIQGKLVVTAQDVTNAEKIVTAIRTGEFTAPAMNMEHAPGIQVYNQVPVNGFVIEGRRCKGLIDRLEINDNERYIQPWDLKCTWSVENFFEEYYIRRRGWLQVATYDIACTHIRNEDYEGYEVRPMKFLVCDSINHYAPLIYTLTTQDLIEAFRGFIHRGRAYKGLIELVRELNWHMDHNIWNMSMQNYTNQGIVDMYQFRIA